MADWETLRDLIAARGINGQVIVSAELGLNHGGYVQRALEMMEAAAEVGCHAVKVQNYRTGDFVKSRTDTITIDGQDWNAWQLFADRELDYETLRRLKDHADKCGLIFHSTPTSEQGIRDLRALGCSIAKIASDVALEADLVAYAFHRMPHLIISTGCLDLGAPLFNHVRDSEDVVLHCVREYPTRISHANLARIGELRIVLKKYRAHQLVGYSDHTEGIECAVSAVRDYKACWIEKHFTLDKTLPGPDHRWSADPKEMAEVVRCLKR